VFIRVCSGDDEHIPSLTLPRKGKKTFKLKMVLLILLQSSPSSSHRRSEAPSPKVCLVGQLSRTSAGLSVSGGSVVLLQPPPPINTRSFNLWLPSNPLVVDSIMSGSSRGSEVSFTQDFRQQLPSFPHP
jgi:hypothetical protein